jgi:hypothetical protein
MNPNIYLNAIVFYRLAQRDQKQKAVLEPEFRRFDLTYLSWDISDAPRAALNGSRAIPPCVAWSPRASLSKRDIGIETESFPT